MTSRTMTPGPGTGPIGIQSRQSLVHIPAHLSTRAVHGPPHYPLLHRLSHNGGLLHQAAYQQTGLGLIQQSHSMQPGSRPQTAVQQSCSPINQVRGPRARDAQTTRDLTDGVPAPRRIRPRRRRSTLLPAITIGPAPSIPLRSAIAALIIARGHPGLTAHIRAPRQALGHHRLSPLRPTGQTTARRHCLAQHVRTQAHQHIGPGAVDDQRPGGIRQSPLTRIHDVPDKAGTVIVSPSSPGTGCTPAVVTAASSAVGPRNRDQQRLHQPLDRSRQSGTRHHPRQARQRIRADTARQQHTPSTAHGDLRGRPSSTPALEHDNRIGSG